MSSINLCGPTFVFRWNLRLLRSNVSMSYESVLYLTLGCSRLTATCSSVESHNYSPSLSHLIAPLYRARCLHGFNHSDGPRQRAVSFIAGSQMYSHHLRVKLCQKGNRNVSVPGEFAWLQLNQKEKHFKYPSPTSSVPLPASHTFSFGKDGGSRHAFHS